MIRKSSGVLATGLKVSTRSAAATCVAVCERAQCSDIRHSTTRKITTNAVSSTPINSLRQARVGPPKKQVRTPSLASVRFRSPQRTQYHGTATPMVRPESSRSSSGNSSSSTGGGGGISNPFVGAIRSSVQDGAFNGILENDDYYVKGVPGSQYKLSDLFDVTQSLGVEPDGIIESTTRPSGFVRRGTHTFGEDSNARVSTSLLKSVFAEHRHVNPFSFVEGDLRSVSSSIREIIGSDHPVLERVASYFFDIKGKRVRPTIVLLMGHALSLCRADVTAEELQQQRTSVTAGQKRLSEITEMFHTASLLHDDVLDEALERRGNASVNAVFGNKLAILGGDFLLARASMALARLQSPKVIEIMSTIIEHLVKGEIMQMRSRDNGATAVVSDVNRYITKSFYKTASIIQHSCWACAVVAGHAEKAQEAAREYGKFLGLAFQIVDDLLDFVGEASVVGKPIHNDLQQGLVTLPVIYAAQAFPEKMNPLIARRFKDIGDVEMALGLVERSNAIQRARDLAIACGDAAVAAALQLPPSKARSALVNLVEIVLERDH